MIDLVLNGVVAALLAATIAYCIVLSRRLRELRDNRGELMASIETFSAATERAESGLAILREAANESGATLDERIKAARALSDDLSFLVERGGPLADRLAGPAGGGRKPAVKVAGPRPVGTRPVGTRPVPLPPAAPETQRDDAKDGAKDLTGEPPRSAVERDLVAALRTARQG